MARVAQSYVQAGYISRFAVSGQPTYIFNRGYMAAIALQKLFTASRELLLTAGPSRKVRRMVFLLQSVLQCRKRASVVCPAYMAVVRVKVVSGA